MNTKTLFHGALALAFAVGNLLANSPKIGCIAEVGEPAGDGRNWALVFLKFLNDSKPDNAYRIYWKPSAADSANSYSHLATIQATKDPTTLAHLVNQAGQAGVDLPSFEAQLDGMIGDQVIPGDTLVEKLAYVLQAQSDTGVIEFQRDTLANSHPIMAVAMGRAYFRTVPAGISTFEIRTNTDPEVVIGRTTIGASPEYLPAPVSLTEREEPLPRGHLRVQLDWAYDQALRSKFLHWGGSTVYRAKRTDWIARYGSPPPVNITRALLLPAVQAGHAVQVNGLPIQAGVVPHLPLDTSLFDPMFTDDNDRAGQFQFQGGEKFVAGDEYTYWVVERDLLNRPGHPSAGAEVVICDRIAPDPPLGLEVHNVRKLEAGVAQDFLQLRWPSADPAEVLQWYVYASENFDDVMAEYDANPGLPESASHIITVPNDGSLEVNGEIILDHLSGMHNFPALEETVFYRLRAEDNTPCKNDEGLGNISGPSGPVPAARHDLMGPTTISGRLATPCCHIEVAYQQTDSNKNLPHTAFLVGRRPDASHFRWVEFADVTNDKFIGRFHFSPGSDTISTGYQPGNYTSPIFRARFGHPGGYISPWRESSAADTRPLNTHIFSPRWNCATPPPKGICPGLHFPIDPSSGEVNDICLLLNPNADIKSWVAYVQFGINGKKVKFDSGTVTTPGPLEVCFNAFPPTGGELCFYAQAFDAGGNPGPMELLGCTKVAPKHGLPTPSITGGNPVADSNLFQLDWVCPPVAERFDVALTPAPANSERRFLQFMPSGIIRHWGIIQTDRVPTAFGANAPEFSEKFDLVKGVNYTAKIRATTGYGEERDEGDWSDTYQLKWLTHTDPVPQVPWPMRNSPGITGEALMEWDADDSLFYVEIGDLPVTNLASPLPADTLEPYLFYNFPLVAYLQETSPTSEGKFLQVTHRFDEILTEKDGGNELIIIDQAVKIRPSNGNASLSLWLRIDQPVMIGKRYRVFLVMHEPNGEIREVLRTNEVFAPLILQKNN